MIGALEAAIGSRDELREEELTALIGSATGLSDSQLRVAARAAEDVIVAALGNGELHARPGGWVLRLHDAAIRASLATAVTAGVMAVAGFDQLPALVLPAVLPLLIDIERVELSPGDRYVLAELRLQPDVVGAEMTPRELYERLPDNLKADISVPDFLDLIQRLTAAGEADRFGAVTIVRDPDDPAWIRFEFR
jgi:hypothetical protein